MAEHVLGVMQDRSSQTPCLAQFECIRSAFEGGLKSLRRVDRLVCVNVRIHLDTDLGGDIDDLQALAYLLASPEAEIVGITTAAEDRGRRAGYVRRVLELARRQDIPVAAGIDVSSGRFRSVPEYPSDADYWQQHVPPAPGAPEEALSLLNRSLDAGALIVGIGPLTNLAMLEEADPGRLQHATVVMVGTTLAPPRDGYLSWGPEKDYNVQMDMRAARTVLTACTPLVVPLGPCLETALRRAHLSLLRSGTPLAALVAHQAEMFDAQWHNSEHWAWEARLLPSDTINFLYDPLACAIAIGWRQDVRIESVPVQCDESDGWLVQHVTPEGHPVNVVLGVDGAAFSEMWVERVAALEI